MEDVKNLLGSMLESIVKFPESIRVEQKDDEMGVLISVWVDKRDMGIVIGKGGTTASALKLITKLAGYKSNVRQLSIKIEEPTE